MTGIQIGLDVGSTTVKAVVMDPLAPEPRWSAYERHGARPAAKALELLRRLETEADVRWQSSRLFVTGSGGGSVAAALGATFVQEVTAVACAVESRHRDVQAVIELGGQDAKIIVFSRDAATGRTQKFVTMNDKCAGGTGAVIDKIAAKLGLSPDAVSAMGHRGIALHRVAGKCGVFAETDINGLQKAGVATSELMASLFEAIVLQNLTVLARGHTLLPRVLLLGGPNRFIRGMREAWQSAIARMWEDRQIQRSPGPVEDAIFVPDAAVFYAALGAIEFGSQTPVRTEYRGLAALEAHIASGRDDEKRRTGLDGLAGPPAALAAFRERYTPPPFIPAVLSQRRTVRAFIGLDGGSTSTKAVLLSEGGDVLAKAYQLSAGNPIEDTIAVLGDLAAQVGRQGAKLEVLGVGTTGYAKDILRDVLQADVALVETVAHAESALRLDPESQVVVDVGGQDIKIIMLRNGRVTDFRLNTQCSAGNGYFLQATARTLGVPLDEFADVAFDARVMPLFSFGCAVFLQSDIVNFQRQGWTTSEILAGLAAVLPKNIFLYVAATPNLARLGSRFVLQGGTQRNLAVVKAEVDFIRASFAGSGVEPDIVVHDHCAEAGAIGAAVEVERLWRRGHRTRFIGLDAVRQIRYRATRSEETRCRFCKNACLRTFIDVASGTAFPEASALPPGSRVPLPLGARRLISASCEKGGVEDVGAMRRIKAALDERRDSHPNFVEIAEREVWRPRHPAPVAARPRRRAWLPRSRRRRAAALRRSAFRVAMPRVLYMHVHAPFFNAYFESLGLDPDNLVYSDRTSDELYRTGSTRGSIDPCFPSKIGLAHVHNLLFVKHAKLPIDCIFFPMIDSLASPLVLTAGERSCPTVAGTPQSVRAAFTKEANLFADRGVGFVHPFLNFSDPALLARQMLEAWSEPLGLSSSENEAAVDAGFQALGSHEASIRARARAVLDDIEREGRIGVVLLARPYHQDAGINHEILAEVQRLGYPVFSQGSLPLDPDLLDRLFGEEVRQGAIRHPLDIGDVWKNSYSASTNQKLWAAKFIARHPNLVALELSSFKCGHDAPVYSVIESIVERSQTPYFCFRDIDENRPAASIKIRVETIGYVLQRYQDELRRPDVKRAPSRRGP